jgi:mono/diheme cytochrome c family protein
MTTPLSTPAPASLGATTLVVAALGLGLAAPLAGCRGDREDRPPRQFFPDMDDSPKWEPQGQSDFFSDGRMMRRPPAGSVAFGRQNFAPEQADPEGEWGEAFERQRADLVKLDDGFYTGRGPDGLFLATMPADVTRRLIERGRGRYNIYCAVCHGYEGDGQGMVGNQNPWGWSYAVPSFHLEAYVQADAANPSSELWKDGYLFHIARNGKYAPDGRQLMPPYAHAIDERDGWAVVAYIRALQASRRATLNDIPEAERAALERQRAARPAQPATPDAAQPATPAQPASPTGGTQ